MLKLKILQELFTEIPERVDKKNLYIKLTEIKNVMPFEEIKSLIENFIFENKIHVYEIDNKNFSMSIKKYIEHIFVMPKNLHNPYTYKVIKLGMKIFFELEKIEDCMELFPEDVYEYDPSYNNDNEINEETEWGELNNPLNLFKS